MGRKKKQINEENTLAEPIICDPDPMEDDVGEENDESTKKGEILVGDHLKIMVRDRYYEIYELKKCKKTTKDALGVETTVEFEEFKSQCLYPGDLISACNLIKQYLAKNKIHEKGTVGSLNEAIKIIEQSYKDTDKMFEGIGDI
jgi:hypothetical protein